jgi:TRAP-type C4-dicarboxylate transport system permease small subunit
MTTAAPLRQSLSVAGRPLEEWAACGLVAVISICVCLQVFSRYVLHIGLVWTEDVAMFAMTWAVYFGAAMAVHEKFHVRMMAAVMMLPYRAAWVITFLADLVWAAFLVFMMIYGWEYLDLLWRQQTIVASMKIDAKWFQTIIVIGNGLMLYRLIEAYLHWWRGDRKGFPTVENEEAPDL